jgi:hypothetical protein
LVRAPHGSYLAVEVKRRSLVRDGDIRQLSDTAGPTDVRIVVGDRITSTARALLSEAGWSWLDLRGHLHVAGPGILIDAPVSVVVPARDGRMDPLAGQVAPSLALLALLEPTEPISVRPAARDLGRAASSVSEALARMRSAGLLDSHTRAVVPDLFDALAAHWSPVRIPIATLPNPRSRSAHALELGLDGDGSGWVVTDTVAASAYGAPVALGPASAPDFYVPSRAALDVALRLLGGPTSMPERAATVAIAPVSVVTSRRVVLDAADSPWPIAHPVVVALDLAQDPGRGAEILQSWTPREPWSRVW